MLPAPVEEDGVLGRTYSSLSSHILVRFSGDKYNASGRDLKDHISVLNIDTPGTDGLYGLRTLQITGTYQSSIGGKEIDVHGIDFEVLSPTRLHFWMVESPTSHP